MDSVLGSFTGKVISVTDFDAGGESPFGCYKLIELVDAGGQPTNFIISPSTYILDHEKIYVGDTVTGYYNTNVPVPLIYPPRYQAVILIKHNAYQNTYVGYFNSQLISSDNALQIIPTSRTVVELPNGMTFNGTLENNYLIVIYGPSTRSIPAQTTPTRIVVLCSV